MSFVKTKSFYKFTATNNSGEYLLISDATINKNIAGVGERECLILSIPKNITNGISTPITIEDINNFINGDNSSITIKAIVNNAITGLNTIVNGDEEVIDVYENYDMDVVVYNHTGDNYKIYMFKRTDAYINELQNKEDLVVLYEAIAEQYEAKYALAELE